MSVRGAVDRRSNHRGVPTKIFFISFIALQRCVANDVVCRILFLGRRVQKYPLLLFRKSRAWSVNSGFRLSLSVCS